MPYERNSDLPTTVRDALPVEAQTVFRTIVNNALEQYDDEGKAFATAWAGLRRAGWERDNDGKWRKVEKMHETTWTRPMEIRKQDDDRMLVFGWLSIATDKDGGVVVDSQGDIIPPEELEKAAYDYVLHARDAGEMHQRTGIGRLVESMVFTKEKQEVLGIPTGVLPEHGWWIGFKIDDVDVWKKIKSGSYRAFSIGGKAKRERQGGEM